MNDGRERLYRLLDEYRGGRLDTAAFCTEFERVYNFDVKKDQLAGIEREAFQRLFNRVVYYSPFPEERSRIANYLGDDEIREAVDDTMSELRYSPRASN